MTEEPVYIVPIPLLEKISRDIFYAGYYLGTAYGILDSVYRDTGVERIRDAMYYIQSVLINNHLNKAMHSAILSKYPEMKEYLQKFIAAIDTPIERIREAMVDVDLPSKQKLEEAIKWIKEAEKVIVE